MEEKSDKIERILRIYTKLINGDVINKSVEADLFGVNERSIQRDIEDIRGFMDKEALESGIRNTVVYDRLKKGYLLEKIYDRKLKNSEILAICKILLDSRAFTKDEMSGMISRLIACCAPKTNHKEILDLIKNEEFHYIEPHHHSKFIDKMWDIGKAIREQRYIEVSYQKLKDKALVTRKLKPVALMFSEYYFYIAAFIDDDEVKAHFEVPDDLYPTIYRIDRIKEYKILDEHFRRPYKDRFEEGEFRKRIQFMYGGKLQKVRFKYSGYSVEAILDRLPTAVIEDEEDGVYTISAEVFGKGIDMWLRSQGETMLLL